MGERFFIVGFFVRVFELQIGIWFGVFDFGVF